MRLPQDPLKLWRQDTVWRLQSLQTVEIACKFSKILVNGDTQPEQIHQSMGSFKSDQVIRQKRFEIFLRALLAVEAGRARQRRFARMKEQIRAIEIFFGFVHPLFSHFVHIEFSLFG